MDRPTLDSTGILDAVIGGNLRRIRLDRQIPQQVLAAHMNSAGNKWTATTVSAVEKGRRNLSFREVADLLRLLHVSMDRLLAVEESEITHDDWIRAQLLMGATIDHEEPPIDHHLFPEDDGISLEDTSSPAAQLLIAQERRLQETVWRALFGVHPTTDDRVRLHQASLFLFERPLILERQKRLQEMTGSTVVDSASTRTVVGHVTRSIIADFQAHLSEGGTI
jgi:transcriptional regulator with XRE-family HTH domain